MMHTRLLAIMALGTLGPVYAGLAQDIRFNRHIRPILSEHCFSCHGPDAAGRKGKIRLDTKAGADQVIQAGDLDASELIRRILSHDPDVIMPPPETHNPLDEAKRERLKRWVEEGAAWEAHWSFIPPRRGALPEPEGIDRWAKNPIDHFILARIREAGLRANPEADTRTLARRAALDITGLPPEDEHLDLEYPQLIETLLNSPHAGEHRARFWLDAARYGDTHGMHLDNYREIWPYRDWVVDAFNQNMAFDQFTIEQIAGDLLPKRTPSQQIATGFVRCNVTTAEGGSIPEELDVRYMVDRVETVGTVFLGMTMGCAVCHDHKYDPISQKDFYSLGAFFNNTTQPAMDGNQKDAPPVLVLPKRDYQSEWQNLQNHRRLLSAEIARIRSSFAPGQIVGKVVRDEHLTLDLPLVHGEIELADGVRWSEQHPGGARGIRIEKGAGIERRLPMPQPDQPLTVSFWIRTPDRVVSTTIMEQYADKKDDKDKPAGWKITSGTQGGLNFEFRDAKGKSIKTLLPGETPLKPRSWQHVCVRYSGGQANSALTIARDGEFLMLRKSNEQLIGNDPIPGEGLLKIGPKLPTGGLSDIRIYRRWLTDEEVRREANTFNPTAEDARTHALLTGHERYRQLSRELAHTQTRFDYVYARSNTTLVVEERPTPAQAWVLQRGQYDQRGERVTPKVPEVLPPLAADAPANRLGLAQWLVSRDNPLTARVTVNRLWQSFFGVGLVKTAYDFGVMGEIPSHPALLDWLAVELIESGWDVRHLIRLIVTSATYRQSSVVTPDKLRTDPDNRLLARGPRVRLDAEVLRDQALAVSGLLNRRFGGPPVNPYQPKGLWKAVAFAGSNTADFKQDSGEALYRRSLYTFWKRTSPPATMATFNAPTRESCIVQRERTNTPLQALVLMNDPQFVEAARHLATRAIQQENTDHARAAFLMASALHQQVRDADIQDVLDAVGTWQETFTADPNSAAALIATGDSPVPDDIAAPELAVWTMAANLIMNRDDFIMKP